MTRKLRLTNISDQPGEDVRIYEAGAPIAYLTVGEHVDFEEGIEELSSDDVRSLTESQLAPFRNIIDNGPHFMSLPDDVRMAIQGIVSPSQ